MSAPSLTRPALLPERLAQWAATRPGDVAYSFLSDGVNVSSELTWSDLHARVLALAGALRERLPDGSRVLLLLPPGPEVLIGAYACMAAGLVGVPVAVPSARQAAQSASRIKRVTTDSGASGILSLASIANDLAGDELLGELQWLVAEDWPAPDGSMELPPLDPGALAYLQYTSGSTSKPRGVMLTHEAFVGNIHFLTHRCHILEQTRLYTWVPPWHDMGLVGGVLTGAFLGTPTFIVPPHVVIRRPEVWMQGISKHRITTTGGPDFAYRLAADRVNEAVVADLDLSSWEVAYSGAEPVRASTLERFNAAFGPAGFRPETMRPGFGMAEIGLVATCTLPGTVPNVVHFDREALGRGQAVAAVPTQADDDGRTTTLVGNGESSHGHRNVIVDPDTGQRVPEGTIGEIWITGPGMALGYWGQPEATAETFGARLPDEPNTAWIRTGDLGFHHRGELFISGRMKDLLIVRGVKYHAVDLELAAQESHELLRIRPAAAFSEEPLSERVILAIESPVEDLQDGPLAQELLAAVRRGVAMDTGLTPARILLTPQRTIPRTTSGKVQRSRCRDGVTYGVLPVIAEWSQPAPAGDAT